jgi:CubicO group peptidase (beta-lactamase class C family)
MSRERLSILRRTAQRYIDAGTFAGIEWQVKRNGVLRDAGTLGCTDHKTRAAIPEQAIYRIYSMTKPVVAVMAVMLLEQNRLHLFDPVSNYIPEFKGLEILHADGSREAAAGPITIEHLFTHRAGLSYDFLPDCPVGRLYRQARLAEDGTRSLTDFVNEIAQLPIAFAPGSRWQYSCSIDVLARVIEVIADSPIGDLLEQHIFNPLEMRDTRFFVKPDDLARLMPMHGRSLDKIMDELDVPRKCEVLDVTQAYPAQESVAFARGGIGLFSTASDYLRFAEFIMNGKSPSGEIIISRKMVDFMWANRLPDNQIPIAIGPFPQPGYGWNLLGRVMLDLGQAMNFTGLGEGGWAGAATTFFWADRDEEMAGVVMTQHLGSLSPMGFDMRAAAYQALD